MVVVMLTMLMTMVMVTMVVDLHWFQIQIHPLAAFCLFNVGFHQIRFFQFKVILDCNGCFHVRNAFVFALEDFSINGF